MHDLKRILWQMGFGYLKLAIHSFAGFWSFLSQYSAFRRRAKSGSINKVLPHMRDLFYCPGDNTSTTGYDRHYIYHTAWAARMLAQYPPKEHVDISSALAWGAIVSAFVPVRFYDFRPPDIHLDNFKVDKVDITALPFTDGSIVSLSCMHVVEHIGLGRYGDPLDPNADAKAIAELKRVLAPGGRLLFVAPIGKPRIAFHAHRIYSFEQIKEAFAPLQIGRFAFIPEIQNPKNDGLLEDVDVDAMDKEKYGCGCFLFI